MWLLCWRSALKFELVVEDFFFEVDVLPSLDRPDVPSMLWMI